MLIRELQQITADSTVFRNIVAMHLGPALTFNADQ